MLGKRKTPGFHHRESSLFLRLDDYPRPLVARGHDQYEDLWNKTIPKLVMAKSDDEFNSVYDAFVKQMDRIGAQKVEKVMYARHLADLQKKGLK